MKRIILTCFIIGCLASCAKYQMPPFNTSGEWRTEGNLLVNDKVNLKIDASQQSEEVTSDKNDIGMELLQECESCSVVIQQAREKLED